jgi:ABC-type phosphate transport system permease subunit
LWGLLAGTLLSLLVVPVMHSLIDDMSVWVNRKVNQLRGRNV